MRLERVVNCGCLCADSLVGVDDGTNYGIDRILVSRNDAYVTTHYLDAVYLTGKSTVGINNKALGTDTNEYVAIGDTGTSRTAFSPM